MNSVHRTRIITVMRVAFWNYAAQTALPHGYAYVDTTSAATWAEGQIVIHMAEFVTDHAHFFQLPVMHNICRPIKYTTYCWRDGALHRFNADNEVDGITTTIDKLGTRPTLITPAAAAAAKPAVPLPTLAPVFATHLRGPPDFAASPQTLAQRWNGHLIIAFAMNWGGGKDDDGSSQGFLVLPTPVWTWNAFRERILDVTPAALRTFFEVIPSSVRVRLYFDLDGKWRKLAALGYDVAHIAALLADCIDEAFATCYPREAAVRPFNARTDIHWLDASSERYNKMSLHGVGMDASYVWRNTRSLKTFVARVRVLLFQRIYGRDPRVGKMHKLLDLSVYDFNKKFRLWLCTKLGQQRPLRYAALFPGGAVQPLDYGDLAVVVENQNDPNLRVLDGLEQAEEDRAPAQPPKRRRLDPATELENYPYLHAFLMPYRVPLGSPHNVRWFRTVSDYIFRVPARALAELAHAMASETEPLFVNEAPLSDPEWNEYQRVVIDFDGGTIPQLDDAIFRIKQILGVKVDHEWLECAPRPGAGPGARFIHVAFQCVVRCQHAAALMQRISAACPPEWRIDAGYTALRTCNSDKYAKNGPANRTLRPGHGGVADAATLARCSLLCGLDGLPKIELTEAEKNQPAATAKAKATPITLAAAEQIIIADEINAHLTLGATRITKTTLWGGVFQCSTNSRECVLHTDGKVYQHKSFTQRAHFGPHGWWRECWDPACDGRSALYAYRAPEAVHAILARYVAPPVAAAAVERDDAVGKERAAVLRVFPEDAQHWRGGGATWCEGDYFGPRGDYAVDYCWGAGHTALMRRTKLGPGRPVACCVRECFNDNIDVAGATCDWALAIVMLRKLNAMMKSVGMFQFQFDHADRNTCCIFYYHADNAKLDACIQFKGAVRSTLTVYDRATGEPHVRELASFAQTHVQDFMRTVRLRATPLDGEAERARKAWAAIDTADVYIDDSEAGDMDFSALPPVAAGAMDRLLVCGPPGCNKTGGMRDQLHFRDGDIVGDSRVMCAKLRKDFGTANYLECTMGDDGVKGKERVRTGLAHEPRPVTICIKSYDKLGQRPAHIKQQFFDESTASLTSLAGDFMKAEAPSILDHLVRAIRSPRWERIACASADITPTLEGRLMRAALGPNRRFRVLHKTRPRNASATRCVELGSDAEMWSLYVRILCHNAAAMTRDAWVNVFFAANAKSVVKRAEALQRIHWPEGPCIFVHGETQTLPEGFIENPNDTWDAYSIICVSPKLKVGVSYTKPGGHFHYCIVYGCSNTTSPEDLLQSIIRIRPLFLALFCRIHMQGGSGGGGSGDGVPDVDAALRDFCADHDIERAYMGLPYPAAPVDKILQWLRRTVAKERAFSERNYTFKVRQGLRLRQMEVELGGLPLNSVFVLGDDTELAPLPPDTDISGPNLKAQHAQDVLDAAVIDDVWDMLEARRKRTLTRDELLQLERYELHKAFRPGGALTFREYVMGCLCKKLAPKLRKAALVAAPLKHVAGIDEDQRAKLPVEKREQPLLLRRNVLAFLALMPGDFQLTATAHYRVTRAQLENGEVARRQETMIRSGLVGLPTRSTSECPVKRTISHCNKALRSMALIKLKAVAWDQTPDGGGKRPKIATAWEWDGSCVAGVLFQSCVEPERSVTVVAPGAKDDGGSVLVTNPEIDSDNVLYDPSTGTTYNLAPLLQGPGDGENALESLSVQVLPEFRGDLGATLSHMLRTADASLHRDPCVSVTWDLFHRELFHCITFPRSQHEALYKALRELGFTKTNVPRNARRPSYVSHPPIRPCHCLEPRVRLRRAAHDPTLWTLSDESLYAPPPPHL